MIQSIDIPALPGHADAFGELLMGGASHDVQHLEVGVCCDPQPGEADSYGSGDFTMVDGSSSTTSGSIGTNVAKLYVGPAPQQICRVDALPHVGVKRIRARVHASAESYVRFRWRLATGAWIFGRWVKVTAGTWHLPLLGVADIPKLPVSHSWTVGIDAYSPTGATVSVDKINPLAADRWMVATAKAADETLLLSDDFNQTSGNATGKSLGLGGAWSGGGDSDDFTINTSDGRLQRTATSDTADAGRRIWAGSAVGDCRVSMTVLDAGSIGGLLSPSGVRRCALLRYVDSANFAYAGFAMDSYVDASSFHPMKIFKRVANTVAVLDTASIPVGWNDWVQVDAVGTHLTLRTMYGTLTVEDSDFASGGALATGKCGIYDEYRSASAGTRQYDNFRAWEIQRSGVLFNGEESRLAHDRLEAEHPGGAWGAIPGVRGNYLKLPSGRTMRLVVSASQYDVDSGAQHLQLTSPLDLDLTAIPRVTMLGA